MARPRQPINLLEAKGKKHLTNEEIENRRASEIVASADNIVSPDYLTAKQKENFKKIADQLIALNIMSNLDCDALANYIISLSNYVKFTKLLNSISVDEDSLKSLESAANLQDKAFKQCRASASDLGLTISSRCKLVVPKKEEPLASKWDEYKAGGVSE